MSARGDLAEGGGLGGLPPTVYGHGFSWRKRAIMRRFAGGARVRFVSAARAVPADGVLLLWGSKAPPRALAAGVRLVRVEDGFLRSVGLGADMVAPLSWVLDQRGMYYDASRPSDLECLLQGGGFGPALLARAATLRRRILDNGLTKYNVGAGSWRRPAACGRVILVPGQVESDASIRLGAPGVCTNIGLLRAVRAAHPDAYVLYKPHPDVVAGLRRGGRGEQEARRWCDDVVTDVAMDRLLAAVDEVHVLTSLSGFEALLRGLPVTCYGQPFYAGWGLSVDVLPPPRRSRRLTLDELVAGALILYPRYVARDGGHAITAEQALDELLAWRGSAGARAPRWRRLLRAWLAMAGGAR